MYRVVLIMLVVSALNSQAASMSAETTCLSGIVTGPPINTSCSSVHSYEPYDPTVWVHSASVVAPTHQRVSMSSGTVYIVPFPGPYMASPAFSYARFSSSDELTIHDPRAAFVLPYYQWSFTGNSIYPFYYFTGPSMNGVAVYPWMVPAHDPMYPDVSRAPITPGQPFPFVIEFYVAATGDYVGTELSLDLRLTNLLVLDASGQPISGYRYSAASGEAYPFLGAINAVPEPSTGLLVIAGLALAGVVGSRRRRLLTGRTVQQPSAKFAVERGNRRGER